MTLFLRCHHLITCLSLPWIKSGTQNCHTILLEHWNIKFPLCHTTNIYFFLVDCSRWFFSSDFPVSFLDVILFLFLFFIIFTPHCSSWGDYIPRQHALSEARLPTAFAAYIARAEQNDAFEHWRFCLQMIKIIQCGGRLNAMTKLWEKIKFIESGTCSDSDPVAL